ncbi:hypothetical protein TKK_0005298 [Trichogramma kaykai]|uniref:HTH CENPB-type domain-containing protein n=1 Tax=Trichogramma kaykai TaxID=54128 RepID=A0ABD2XI66_9HYME
MVNNYKKKTNKNSWTEEQMQQAIDFVKDGKSILASAQEFGIPRSTLQKKLKLLEACHDFPLKTDYQGGFKRVFSAEQEEAFVQYILNMEHRLMGLSSTEIRRLAFQWAEKLKISHPFNHRTGLAGKDWLRAFMSRHKLSLRKPEHTSTARAKGFNKENVAEFFTLLHNLMNEYKFDPKNIYNCDETGITVCPKSSSRIVTSRGKRQIGGLTAADRGETVSAEICMSATGVFMPSLLIFPRVKENPEYLVNKPPGSWAVFDKSGWMSTPIFKKWFEEFLKFSKASETNPVLLILDGHASHIKNIEVIDLVRENHVHILCLPPHCSHRMQPLDVGFMKPLSSYYSEALTAFQRKGAVVTMKNIFGLFGTAFMKAAKMETAVNSFKKCGIWPLNPDIFADTDYAAVSRTNYQKQNEKGPDSQNERVPESQNERVPENPNESCSSSQNIDTVNMSKESQVDSSSKVNRVNISQYKDMLSSLVQTQADAVIQNMKLEQELEKTKLEPVVEIPISYILQAQPLINCLNTIVAKYDKSIVPSQLQAVNLATEKNNAAPKKEPKKRKIGKSAIITNDNYRDSLLEALAKKVKVEKTEVDRKKQKPLVKSIVGLPVNHLINQTNNKFNIQPAQLSSPGSFMNNIGNTVSNQNGILNAQPLNIMTQNQVPIQVPMKINNANVDFDSIPIIFA